MCVFGVFVYTQASWWQIETSKLNSLCHYTKYIRILYMSPVWMIITKIFHMLLCLLSTLSINVMLQNNQCSWVMIIIQSSRSQCLQAGFCSHSLVSTGGPSVVTSASVIPGMQEPVPAAERGERRGRCSQGLWHALIPKHWSKNSEDDQIDYKEIYNHDQLLVKEVSKILMTKYYKFTKIKATVHGNSSQTNLSAAESRNKVDDDTNYFWLQQKTQEITLSVCVSVRLWCWILHSIYISSLCRSGK